MAPTWVNGRPVTLIVPSIETLLVQVPSRSTEVTIPVHVDPLSEQVKINWAEKPFGPGVEPLTDPLTWVALAGVAQSANPRSSANGNAARLFIMVPPWNPNLRIASVQRITFIRRLPQAVLRLAGGRSP